MFYHRLAFGGGNSYQKATGRGVGESEGHEWFLESRGATCQPVAQQKLRVILCVKPNQAAMG